MREEALNATSFAKRGEPRVAASGMVDIDAPLAP